jgi:hypothetical protein
MALYTKVNGEYQEITDRLTIKSPERLGYMDDEDNERLQQISEMVSSDIEQTLETRQKYEEGKIQGWSEDDVIVKGVMEHADPGAIRIFGITAIAALTSRWQNMKDPKQRKAEMLALMGAEGWALQYSAEHDLIHQDIIPPFFITLWARRF